MRRCGFLVLLCGWWLLAISQVEAQAERSGPPAEVGESRLYTVDALRADFTQFRRLVETEAVNPYRFTDREPFDRAFDEGYRSIDRPMTLREFYTRLLPLKAMIGCGHCHLDYPQEYRKGVQTRRFPLIPVVVEERFFVKKSLSPTPRIPPFAEILSINGIRIDRILSALRADISADGHNPHFRDAALESCFQYYHANRYGTPSDYTIGFRTEGGDGAREIILPALACDTVPYSTRESSGLGCEILADRGAAVMRVGSFIYYGDKNRVFFSFLDRGFQRIRREKIDPLIIDLRGNGGGDPFCAARLLSYLERTPVAYFSQPYGRYAELARPVPRAAQPFTGKVYVLIDGAVFSTTAHLCALLHHHDLAVFVGEETGGTYTCNAAVRGFSLEHTRLHVKLSTATFAAAVSGFPPARGILPDHAVHQTVRDLRRGRDTVLDYTLMLIAGERSR